MDGHPGRRGRGRADGRADVQVQALGVRHGCGGRGAFGGAVRELPRPFITPNNFTLQFSILFLAAVVLGGAGNIPGVILGAFLVAYLPERFRGLGSGRTACSAFGVALVLMMIFRPQGLLPEPAPGRRARRRPNLVRRRTLSDRGRHRARRRADSKRSAVSAHHELERSPRWLRRCSISPG